jgi:L-seryl-tRNA(Ser) seleniumtransferase
VTASGDKLLGGPQAGLLFGAAELVERLRRDPLARAMRVDKLTLAALEATLVGPPPPVAAALAAEQSALWKRATRIAELIGAPLASTVATSGRVGGGGAPGVELPSAGIALPERLAAPLRTGARPVVGRLVDGRLVLDLLAVPVEEDDAIVQAVRAVTSCT